MVHSGTDSNNSPKQMGQGHQNTSRNQINMSHGESKQMRVGDKTARSTQVYQGVQKMIIKVWSKT